METKEEKAARVNAAIQMLTPPDNPAPMPGQIEAAKVQIGAAMESLSLAKKTAMLEGLINATVLQDIKTDMTAAQFKLLGGYWKNARELGRVLGLSAGSVYLYQCSGSNTIRTIPKRCAKRLIEARMKYNIQHNVTEDPILDSVLQAMGLK